MTRIRKKGIAIVNTRKGILVVAGRKKIFALPGGGANRGESRKKAAIRELNEETRLKAKSTKYLFSYKGRKWHTRKGKPIRNYGKVFLIKASGKAKPRHEIKYISYWNPKSKIRISHSTQGLINKYLNKNY